MRAEYKVTIHENGRMVLPIKVRQQMQIVPGDQVLLIMDQDIKIIPLKNSVQRIQNKIKKMNTLNISLVDSLKETRDADFKHE